MFPSLDAADGPAPASPSNRRPWGSNATHAGPRESASARCRLGCGGRWRWRVVRRHSRPSSAAPASPTTSTTSKAARAFCKEFFYYYNHEPPLRTRTAHPRIRPLWNRREAPRRPRRSPRRLRPQPRTVQPASRVTQTADRRVDQPTQRAGPTTEQLRPRSGRRSPARDYVAHRDRIETASASPDSADGGGASGASARRREYRLRRLAALPE